VLTACVAGDRTAPGADPTGDSTGAATVPVSQPAGTGPSAVTGGTTPTRLTVRVIAADGKYLGADIGGAQVTVRDAATGVVLASGVTEGNSGDTAAIMSVPRARSTPLPIADASVFRAALPIEVPTQLEVTAEGPIGGLQSTGRASTTLWLLPGVDLIGDQGLRLELRGLVVQVMEPATHTNLTSLPQSVPIVANVTMMCGCPIAPDSPWPADAVQVAATIRRGGAVVAQVPLEYAGTTSRFSGSWQVTEPGFYEADVHAVQQDTGNTGVGRVTFFTSLPATPGP
jgi:hypothetical protein